ncbi:MAG: oligosaccharide flippase family protein [Flavobacterium sp.]|nr:oligosaccharide flippase family protein [Flavobacterium sp.]
MKNSRLVINSLSAVGQVIAVGITYLVLYRYLKDTIGIELLGVWSLIIATTSVALIANFGISTSIIKFVATYHTRGDLESLKKLIFTSSVFIIVTYTIISLLILVFGNFILPYVIEKKYVAVAQEILPYSLISLIINALGGVISSCLDGIQKNYIKSYILSFSALILLVLSMLLTKDYGLKGLVFAQIFQGILVLLISVFFIARSVPGIFTLKWNWSKTLFKEIIDYGLKMQALSIMQMSFEPITKVMLSKFGGVAMVGYYEMANRLVSQFRSLIVSANQVVIPIVAEAKENNTGYIKSLYLKTFSIVFILNILLVSGIIVMTPLISYFWIGEIVPFFIFAVVLNCIAVFINICSNPAYFSYLGEGQLNWLIYSYFAITVINALFCYVFGLFFKEFGVVIAWNLAFSIGSLIVVYSYQIKNKIQWKELLNSNDLQLLLMAFLYSIFGFKTATALFNGHNNWWFAGLFLICLSLFILLFLKNQNVAFVLNQIKRKPSTDVK